jgi:hypothetical protein
MAFWVVTGMYPERGFVFGDRNRPTGYAIAWRGSYFVAARAASMWTQAASRTGGAG